MRMRTMKEAIEELKRDDPGTSLTYYGLRRLVLSGVIPSMRMGQKRLIDIDSIGKYICAPAVLELDLPGQIQPIRE